ncbi:MAG TPA: hypothetical protein VJB16_01130, partial [archaeon]|nr:hypothetical protein [archaeon]
CLDSGSGTLVWKFASSMSTPSEIAPTEATTVKNVQVTVRQESGERSERYKQELAAASGGPSVYATRTSYATSSQYATRSKYGGNA